MMENNNSLTLFEDKVKIAIERIQAFKPLDNSPLFVAFSGGKDSIVMYEIVKMSGIKHQAYYNVTGMDHPELFRFIKEKYPEVIRLPVRTTLWELIVKNKIPPTMIIRYCCRELKERSSENFTNSIIVTGIRWQESVKRSKRRMVEPCLRDTKKHYLNPIIDWSEHDVWEFIHKYKLEYCKLYDMGYKRLGCIGCPMSKNQKEEIESYPKFKKLYLLAFERMLKARDSDKDYKYKWKNANDVMKWYVNKDKKRNIMYDDSIIFE